MPISSEASPAVSGPSSHALGRAQLVAWGATYYAMPVLLPNLVRERALSGVALAQALTLGLLLSAFAAPLVGRWIGQRGPRSPLVVGSLVASLALLVIALSETGSGVLLGVIALCATQSSLLYESAFAAVATQTVDAATRVRGIQVVTAWGGWAALWAIPLTMVLSARWGHRPTLLLLAGLLLVQTLPVHLRVASRQRPSPPTSCKVRVPYRLTLGFALGAFITVAVGVHGLVFLCQRGVDEAWAATALSLLAPVQVAARHVFRRRDGKLLPHDRWLPFGLVAASMLALGVAVSLPAIVVFVVLFGAGSALLTTVRASLMASLLPPDALASQLASMNFVITLVRAGAPSAAAWAAGAMVGGSSALVAAGIALLGGALVWSARSTAVCRGPSRDAECGGVPCP